MAFRPAVIIMYFGLYLGESIMYLGAMMPLYSALNTGPYVPRLLEHCQFVNKDF